MTEKEALHIEEHLTETLKIKYPDIRTHVDLANETDEIIISFFWERISLNQWNNAKTFRMKNQEYQKTLKSKILPFFNQ